MEMVQTRLVLQRWAYVTPDVWSRTHANAGSARSCIAREIRRRGFQIRMVIDHQSGIRITMQPNAQGRAV